MACHVLHAKQAGCVLPWEAHTWRCARQVGGPWVCGRCTCLVLLQRRRRFPQSLLRSEDTVLQSQAHAHQHRTHSRFPSHRHTHKHMHVRVHVPALITHNHLTTHSNRGCSYSWLGWPFTLATFCSVGFSVTIDILFPLSIPIPCRHPQRAQRHWSHLHKG